ncbi:MAG: recombinase family protein [Candidatus Edwardsbacteria bacterium]
MNSNTKPVGIWIRVSTDMQDENESPRVHEARAKSYADAKGWQVAEKYLLVTSGKSVIEHPETKRMFNDIRTGHIKALIFSKLARLGRNVKELIEIADYFRKYDADLVSLQESLDTSTPGGRLLFNFIACLAQWEREEIASRVAASVPVRAKLGRPLGGKAPFGYEWQEKKLIINEQESFILKKLFETFINCQRIKTTARLMNQAGYRTRKKKLWTDSTVRRLLQDSTSKGIHILNHTKSRGEGKGWDKKPKEDWVELKVEPIIKEELWTQANLILKKNAKPRTKKPRAYLLSGLVQCSECNSKMYGYAYGRAIPCYKCKCGAKIYMQELDNVFIETLKHYEFNPKDLIAELPNNKTLKEIDKEIEIVKRSIAKNEQEIDKLIGLHFNKLIDDTTLKDKVSVLEERREQLKQEKATLEGQSVFLKVKENSLDFVMNQVKNFTALQEMMTFEEKRSLIEQLVESIKISKETIEINLYFFPAFQKNLDLELLKKGDESMTL